MKYVLILFSSVISVLFTGCYIDNSVSGEGNVTEKVFNTGQFSEIEISNNLEYLLIPADKNEVVMLLDSNLYEYVNLKVDDDRLIIHSRKSIGRSESKLIKIYYINLNKIDASGASILRTQSTVVDSDLLVMNITSASQAELELQCKELKIEVNSAAHVTLTGKADKMKADVNSAADLKAFDFIVKEADVEANSAATAKVHITEKATFNASSAGTVKYKGNPDVKNINSSGAATIKHID